MPKTGAVLNTQPITYDFLFELLTGISPDPLRAIERISSCVRSMTYKQQLSSVPVSLIVFSHVSGLNCVCRTMQDMENPQVTSCNKGDQHYRSSPSNQSSSSDPGPCGSTSWSQQAGYDGYGASFPSSPIAHCRTR